jgi:hypothetical protein
MLILKCHYVTHYRQLRKEFLNHLENLMTDSSLIGFTISTISKKDAPVSAKFSHQVLVKSIGIHKHSFQFAMFM